MLGLIQVTAIKFEMPLFLFIFLWCVSHYRWTVSSTSQMGGGRTGSLITAIPTLISNITPSPPQILQITDTAVLIIHKTTPKDKLFRVQVFWNHSYLFFVVLCIVPCRRYHFSGKGKAVVRGGSQILCKCWILRDWGCERRHLNVWEIGQPF